MTNDILLAVILTHTDGIVNHLHHYIFVKTLFLSTQTVKKYSTS